MLSHVFGAATSAIASDTSPNVATSAQSLHAVASRATNPDSRRYTAIAAASATAATDAIGGHVIACAREQSSVPITTTTPVATAARSRPRAAERSSTGAVTTPPPRRRSYRVPTHRSTPRRSNGLAQGCQRTDSSSFKARRPRICAGRSTTTATARSRDARGTSVARSQAMASPSRRVVLALSVLLVLAVAVVYAPVRHAGFFYLDDVPYVTENPFVRDGLTIDGLRHAFFESHGALWMPLSFTSHMLDVTVFGLTPAGPHLVNARCTRRRGAPARPFSTGALAPGAATAALFALHPLRASRSRGSPSGTCCRSSSASARCTRGCDGCACPTRAAFTSSSARLSWRSSRSR
jgi:hypothetical protein